MMRIKHLGSHPTKCQEWVEDQVRRARREAGTGPCNAGTFLNLYERFAKGPLRRNPDMLNKEYWEARP